MTTYLDADGQKANAEIVASAGRCILCPLPCTVRILGEYIHIGCWERSTALQRRERVLAPVSTGPAATTTLDEVPNDRPAAGAEPDRHDPATDRRQPAHQEPHPETPARPQPAQTGAPAEATTTPGHFLAPAVVLDTDALYIASERRDFPLTPMNHIGHIAELAYELNLGTQVNKTREEPGQIWLTTDLLRDHFGLDLSAIADLRRDREEAVRNMTRTSTLVTEALADGWQLGGGDHESLGTWTRVWRGERRGVWIALIPAMMRTESELEARQPMLADGAEPGTIARRLAAFTGQVHMPWVINAATTGIDLMRHLRPKDGQEVFAPTEPVPPADDPNAEADPDWYRKLTAEEMAEHRFIHAYDRGGSYLAGVAGLELPIGEPEHHPQGRAFDKRLPGYWLIEVPDQADWRYPHPLNPRGGLPNRPVWRTTPTLQHAHELDYEVKILEAYVWPQHGRVLDNWYSRLRDARAALDVADDLDLQRARNMVKALYSETVGMIASRRHRAGKPGYAPERRHHVVAKARTNLMRKIIKIGLATGRWPVAVHRDTVFYTSDDPDARTAWPGSEDDYGRGLGQYKHEMSGRLVGQIQFFTGPSYLGKPNLIAAEDWSPADHVDAPYLEEATP